MLVGTRHPDADLLLSIYSINSLFYFFITLLFL